MLYFQPWCVKVKEQLYPAVLRRATPLWSLPKVGPFFWHFLKSGGGEFHHDPRRRIGEFHLIKGKCDPCIFLLGHRSGFREWLFLLFLGWEAQIKSFFKMQNVGFLASQMDFFARSQFDIIICFIKNWAIECSIQLFGRYYLCVFDKFSSKSLTTKSNERYIVFKF